MGKIYFTSDLHFGHDREFIWGPRGFKSVHEMNETIINNWNSIVTPEDDVYVLGDLMLGDNEIGIGLIKRLKGHIHVVRGNHDSDVRIEKYNNCYNIEEVTEGQYLKCGGYTFYLNHFPTFTSNLEKDSSLKHHLINLFGHTHQKTNFYEDIPFMYHVGVDSHNNTPVSVEEIIADIQKKVNECKKFL